MEGDYEQWTSHNVSTCLSMRESISPYSIRPTTSGGMPQCRCPECGYIVDSARCMETSAEPSSGDVSLCLNCGSVNQFTDILTLKGFPNWQTEVEPDQFRMLTAAINIIRKRGLLHAKIEK